MDGEATMLKTVTSGLDVLSNNTTYAEIRGTLIPLRLLQKKYFGFEQKICKQTHFTNLNLSIYFKRYDRIRNRLALAVSLQHDDIMS